jgi:DNA mismatch repair ATPase MutL
MKKISELLIKYALTYPNVRFSSIQSKKGTTASNNSTWIKPITSTIENTCSILFGASYSDMLTRIIKTDPQYTSLTVDIILPKSNSDPTVILKSIDRIYIYVNQRPINYVKSELKQLVHTIRNKYIETIGLNESSMNKKNPFIYIDIQLPPNEYDGKKKIQQNSCIVYIC